MLAMGWTLFLKSFTDLNHPMRWLLLLFACYPLVSAAEKGLGNWFPGMEGSNFMTLRKIVGEVKNPTSGGIWSKEKGPEREGVSSTDATKPAAVQTALWTLGGGQSCRRHRDSILSLSCWKGTSLPVACAQSRPGCLCLPFSLSCLHWALSHVLAMDGPAEKVQVF